MENLAIIILMQLCYLSAFVGIFKKLHRVKNAYTADTQICQYRKGEFDEAERLFSDESWAGELQMEADQTAPCEYFEDGGEHYRKSFLVPALKEAEETGRTVTVYLNEVPLLTHSFLKEAFGGLVREHGYTHSQLLSLLEIETTGDHNSQVWIDAIWRYTFEASEQAIG